MKVSWDDYSEYSIWKNKSHVPVTTNQPFDMGYDYWFVEQIIGHLKNSMVSGTFLVIKHWPLNGMS